MVTRQPNRSGVQSKNSALTFGQIPIARVKRTTKLPDPSVLVSAAELSEVVALTFDARCRRASVGGHARPVETYNRSLIRRSKIFGVEIHGQFDAEPIEIGLEPLVGPCATHAVKMLQKIPNWRSVCLSTKKL